MQIYIGVFIPAIATPEKGRYLNHFNLFSQLEVAKSLIQPSPVVVYCALGASYS